MKMRFVHVLIGWLLAAAMAAGVGGCAGGGEDRLTRLVTRGNGYMEQGSAPEAVAAYEQALALSPDSTDILLNLANAHLLNGDAHAAAEQCLRVLDLDPNSAAAYYLLGCARARLGLHREAVQAFQQSRQIDPYVTALNVQLGMAHAQLNQAPEAIEQFEIAVRFEPDHPSAWYQLSRLYADAERGEDASRALAEHQRVRADQPLFLGGPAALEQCKHTLPREVFRPAVPDEDGIPVRFADATAAAFPDAVAYRGPLALRTDLPEGTLQLVAVDASGLRLLAYRDGRFQAQGEPLPVGPEPRLRRILVGDLDNDRHEDVIALGPETTHVFRFAAYGQAQEATEYSGLQDAAAYDGTLADLDFTGRLDLLTISPDQDGLRVYRNRGGFYFREDAAESGLPLELPGTMQTHIEDWHNQDLPGVFVAREGQPPAYFAKQRAGGFVETNLTRRLPAGRCLISGDLDNDLRPDLVIAGGGRLHVVYSGDRDPLTVRLGWAEADALHLWDYDNDGWLDILAVGPELRVWRNLGPAGLRDVTASLGLAGVGPVDGAVVADFDGDGDVDLVLSVPGGLKFLRNDGGNAHGRLTLRLSGNRSNAGARGVRVELVSGRWRTLRTQGQGPLDIGVGDQEVIDRIRVRWFDTAMTLVDSPVQAAPLVIDEQTLPTGSCPYLYAWDGRTFRFLTDFLGASPMGLPLSKTRLIEADTEEYLALGGPKEFPARDGRLEVRITEELREVLYLDTVRLFAVDHPEGTLVCATSKLLPGRPFPPHALWTLRRAADLQRAVRSDGRDVTEALLANDLRMVSPVRLREPQLRGLAEPYSVTLDFGELPTDRPLALVLTGWLQFGGGMANVSASLDPNLPFPFPMLEAESPDGDWLSVDVRVGAPAGKTKTILVDLAGVLPPGTGRLRLSTAYEIHWDSILLCERVESEASTEVRLPPGRAELRWRGFSEYQPLPEDQPLSPDYEQPTAQAHWRQAVSGWCTRYGPVDDLVAETDNRLVILNAGDELAVSFDAADLPALESGRVRSFFLYCVGWDKDADFHVRQGWTVAPLPYHGMDDQAYGVEPRPSFPDDDWIETYNTRWVGPWVLSGPGPNQGSGPALR